MVCNDIHHLQDVVVAHCAKTGPTTPEAPCKDQMKACPALAKEHCFRPWVGKMCSKSCGKCPGEPLLNLEKETFNILTRAHP